MDLGFKLQYIYCWMCFIKEYNRPLYLTNDTVLENLNTVVFYKDTDNEITLFYQSELDIVKILLENDQLWADVVQQELSLSFDEYLLEN